MQGWILLVHWGTGCTHWNPKNCHCINWFDWQINQWINQSVNRSILTEGCCVDPRIVWTREAVRRYILFQFPDMVISFIQLFTLLRTNLIIRLASSPAVLRRQLMNTKVQGTKERCLCPFWSILCVCSQELGYFYKRSAAWYIGRIQIKMCCSRKYIFTTYRSNLHEKKASYFLCASTFCYSG